MIRRTVLVALALLTGTLWLIAASSRRERADLTYLNPSGIHTLDPARMSWTQDIRVALNIWEGLTAYDPRTLEPVEGAAVFPPDISSDRLTYTFRIRRDARWSNSDRVEAEDFVRGWRRGMEPGTAADYSFLFTEHIAGAAQYVRWRTQGVGVLTALSRLARGYPIDPEDGPRIAGWEPFATVAADAGVVRPGPDAGDTPWHKWAERVSTLPVDWDGLFQTAFQRHADEMDARFAEVGIAAPHPDTFVVRLTRPCPYFLDLTAFATMVPCHRSIELLRGHHLGRALTPEGLVVYDPQWTKPEARDDYPGLITNGAYRLAAWKFKRFVRLEVNPHCKGAANITCRTVDMAVYQDVGTAIMAYEAGDLDFLPAMDVPYEHEIARLARSGERPDFHMCELLATYFYNFNCVSEFVGGVVNPFRDARVRKAFALVVDREAIVSGVLQRGDRPAHSFVPPHSMVGYDPPAGLSMDPDEARRLLAAAGYPAGEGLPPIELLYTPRDELICQAVARMWETQLGVVVVLRAKESKTFGEDRANHRFMIARGNWYADYNDPTTFLNCLATGNGNNDSGYSNPAYDDLLRRADRADSTERRAALLREAERIIVSDDLPILPILHYAAPIAIKPYVKGLYPNPRLLFFFRNVIIER